MAQGKYGPLQLERGVEGKFRWEGLWNQCGTPDAGSQIATRVVGRSDLVVGRRRLRMQSDEHLEDQERREAVHQWLGPSSTAAISER